MAMPAAAIITRAARRSLPANTSSACRHHAGSRCHVLPRRADKMRAAISISRYRAATLYMRAIMPAVVEERKP